MSTYRGETNCHWTLRIARLTVVTRGTMHGWKNTSGDYCRFMTVIIPSEKVKVESTGDYLTSTKLPGLTD